MSPVPSPGEGSPLVGVTDHACERFRQRVGGRAGALDVRPEVIGRVARAWAAGRADTRAPDGSTAVRGPVYVRDLVDRGVVFVCRPDRNELVVVTLWEEERAVGEVRVPRRFTDALRRDDDHSSSS